MNQEEKKEGLLESNINDMNSDVFGQNFSTTEIKTEDNYVPDPSMNNIGPLPELEGLSMDNPFNNVNGTTEINNNQNVQSNSEIENVPVGNPILDDAIQQNTICENQNPTVGPQIDNQFDGLEINNDQSIQSNNEIENVPVGNPILDDAIQQNTVYENQNPTVGPQINNQFDGLEINNDQNAEMNQPIAQNIQNQTLNDNSDNSTESDIASDAEIKKFFKDFLIIAIIVIIIIILLPYASNLIGL